MIFVKPKAGLKIRHPEKLDQVLPEEGSWVAESIAWKRMINDGDVLLDESKVAPTPEKTSKNTKGGRA